MFLSSCPLNRHDQELNTTKQLLIIFQYIAAKATGIEWNYVLPVFHHNHYSALIEPELVEYECYWNNPQTTANQDDTIEYIYIHIFFVFQFARFVKVYVFIIVPCLQSKVFSAALGNALEKLLGRPPTAEDRFPTCLVGWPAMFFSWVLYSVYTIYSYYNIYIYIVYVVYRYIYIYIYITYIYILYTVMLFFLRWKNSYKSDVHPRSQGIAIKVVF